MEAIQEKGTLSVHTEKLFPIIKKWLYSERDIFLRELISNAYDAIYKLERLGDMGQYKEPVEAGKVNISIDAKAKTLTLSDNGLGMTGEEIKKYINQIAFSGAEEFLEKYEKEASNQGIIGHFGLGFFSAFMVGKEVEIITRSHTFPKDPKGAVHWRCTGTTDFSLTSAEREAVGTDIILHVSDENKELLEEEYIKKLIVRFSDFLPVEIALNGKKVNQQNPIWQRNPKDLKEEDYKEFYKHLFPGNEDPLFYVHLSVEFPFQVKGILYFPKIRVDMDVTKTGRLKLFCNNVFVSDNIVDIIPQYLNMLQGVIDSHDIPLNVSRSALQQDGRVKKLASHIVKKLADKLVSLAKNERSQYETYWADIHPFVKFGTINDEDFYDKVKDALLFTSLGRGENASVTDESGTTEKKTDETPKKEKVADKVVEKVADKVADEKAKGENKEGAAKTSDAEVASDEKVEDQVAKQRPMITLTDYKRQNAQLKDKVIYATHEENEHRYIMDVQKLGVEVILLNSPIDPHFMQYLESKLAPLRFLRVDSAPAEELVADEGAEPDKALDEAGEKDYVTFLKELLGLSAQEVNLKTLADKGTPALFVVNEQLRRFQEMSSMMNTEAQKMGDGLMGMTLVLNRTHPLIVKTRDWLRKRSEKKPAERKTEAEAEIRPVLQNIYDLALLRIGKLKGEALEGFIERTSSVLEKTAGIK